MFTGPERNKDKGKRGVVPETKRLGEGSAFGGGVGGFCGAKAGMEYMRAFGAANSEMENMRRSPDLATAAAIAAAGMSSTGGKAWGEGVGIGIFPFLSLLRGFTV